MKKRSISRISRVRTSNSQPSRVITDELIANSGPRPFTNEGLTALSDYCRLLQQLTDERDEESAHEWLSQQLLKWFLLEMFPSERETIANGHFTPLEINIWELRDVIEKYGMAAFFDTFKRPSAPPNHAIVNAIAFQARLCQESRSRSDLKLRIDHSTPSYQLKLKGRQLLEGKCRQLLERNELEKAQQRLLEMERGQQLASQTGADAAVTRKENFKPVELRLPQEWEAFRQNATRRAAGESLASLSAKTQQASREKDKRRYNSESLDRPNLIEQWFGWPPLTRQQREERREQARREIQAEQRYWEKADPHEKAQRLQKAIEMGLIRTKW